MTNELTFDSGIPVTLHYTIANVADPGPTDGVLAGGNGIGGFVVPAGYAFHPVYAGVESNDARTAGTATVKVTADGTEISGGPEAVLDGTNTLVHNDIARPGASSVAAAAEVGVSATGASWTPTTADLDVVLIGLLLPA